MNRLALTLCTALLVPAPLLAQGRTIDPGMSRDQVLTELGPPVTERAAGRFVYLFYPNGCERSCGMQDLVILKDGAVVDAIFRSQRRSYTGTSSSPSSAAPGRTAGAPAPARSSLGASAGRGSIILATPAPGDSAPAPPATIRRAAGATPEPAAGSPAAAGANANPARAEQLLRAPHDSAFTTPQTPPLGSPVPRDSSYVPGIQLRPGEKPVPFQGARPSPADSARRAQERARQPADTTPRPQDL